MTGRVGVASIDVDRRAAFARLVDAQLDASYRIAGVILGSGGDAEDAAHDAVVRAWRSYGTLRDAAKFEAWFQRILVNVCRDKLRKRRRSPVTELEMAGATASPDGFAGVDDRLALDRAFARLSAEQAITVALRYWLDLTVEDVASRMGVPIGTVKSRLHAALALLEGALNGVQVVEL